MRLHSAFILPRLALHSERSVCVWSYLSLFVLLLIMSVDGTLLMAFGILKVSMDCLTRPPMLVSRTN